MPAAQDGGPFLAGRLRPIALRRICRSDGCADLVESDIRDVGQNLAGGRVRDGNHLTIGRLAPLTRDKRIGSQERGIRQSLGKR